MATPFTEDERGLWAEQSVDARMDYGLDWSDWLALSPGDALQDSVWTVDDPDLTLSDAARQGAVTEVFVEGGVAGSWYTLKNVVTTTERRRDARFCLIHIKAESAVSGNGIFKNRAIAIVTLRRDRLTLMANSLMPDVNVSDDYLWEKLRAAESYVSGLLRVPLVPTRYFPIQPTADELLALNGGAWEIDSGYDYEASMFERDKWGYLVTRHRPVLSVEYLRFAYPTQQQGFFDIPQSWIRVDSRPGHIRIVPNGSASFLGTAGFTMASMVDRRTVPEMVQVSYTAGLKNAAQDFPELVDVIKKKAVLGVITDAYIPQSGSISADGLSQSMSVDVGKYSDSIDDIINGPKGVNGGLMTRIHGIRGMVF